MMSNIADTKFIANLSITVKIKNDKQYIITQHGINIKLSKNASNLFHFSIPSLHPQTLHWKHKVGNPTGAFLRLP